MTMPGFGPEETLRRVREIRSDLPVVLCSGYGGEEALRRMTSLDYGAFLAKPFALEQVARALQSALAG
jgi:CheY-like chemotaxis protein